MELWMGKIQASAPEAVPESMDDKEERVSRSQ